MRRSTKINSLGIDLRDNLIRPNTTEWFEWFAANKSFHFKTYSSGYGEKHFTGNKDKNGYWTASRKVHCDLRRKRLGKSENLSLTNLEETAFLLSINQPRGVYTSENYRQQNAELLLELKKAYLKIHDLEAELSAIKNPSDRQN